MGNYPPAHPLMPQVHSFPSQSCPCPDHMLRGCWCRTRSEPEAPQCWTILAPTSLMKLILMKVPLHSRSSGVPQTGATLLGFTLLMSWACGHVSPRWGAKAGGQRGATAPPSSSYTCSKNVCNYYIRHLHSHVSATDGEWSVAISLETGRDAIILPVSCY